jgi:type IV pilus assembly protein PilM
MDELRPDWNEDVRGDEEEVDPSFDGAVIDRLAAYGHEPEAQFEYTPVPEPEYELSREHEFAPAPEPAEPTMVEASTYVEPEPELVPEPVTPAMVDAAPEATPEPELVPDSGPEPFAVEPQGSDSSNPSDPTPAIVEDEPRRFGRRRAAEPKTKPTKERRDKRTKRVVGLKIGASQIAAAQVVNNGVPELVEVYREPLEPGLVVSGEIRDPETLGDVLKRFFELHKLPKRGVRLGLSNNRIGVRIFEIEGVTDPLQLENAIRFRAEEVLPIPLDQAVLDYVVLDEEVRADGSEWKRILLVVAYREVVDRYLQACRRAGLQVVGIDLEAFALLRTLEAPTDRDSNAGALVAVAIGHDRTTIAVSTGRHCEFARVLDWGGWSLNVAIARELDRAPSEVESIKRQLSFADTTDVEGLTAEQVAKTRNGIQRALATFARELVSSLQFYQAQPGALGIGEVVLTGGTAHMDGLVDALGELVGVPIRLGDPFGRIAVGPKVETDGQPGSVAVAIGLGIED